MLLHLDAFETRILGATTVVELEAPFNELLGKVYRCAEKSPLYLSDLRLLTDLAHRRTATLQNLTDLRNQESVEKLGNWFGTLARIIDFQGASSAATGILIDLWNALGNYQHTLFFHKDKAIPHIYRAGVGMYLGQIYKEPGAAMWWLLHAHADDLLGGQPKGAAYDMLRLAFGVNLDTFDDMAKLSESCRQINQFHTSFAEHIVMLLSLDPKHSYLFSHPTSLSDFPIGHAYAETMRQRLTSDPDGKALEEFARYLILLIAGWVPSKNTYHTRTEIDSDIVARFVRDPGTISDASTRAILVECKNRQATLSVAETGYFLYRMHLTQVNVGIVFVQSGISGTSPKNDEALDKNAQHLLDLAQQNGTTVVVIDGKDLDNLVSGNTRIWSLIDSRIIERRFGRTRDRSF